MGVQTQACDMLGFFLQLLGCYLVVIAPAVAQQEEQLGNQCHDESRVTARHKLCFGDTARTSFQSSLRYS